MATTSSEYFEALRAARDFLRHVCGYEYLHSDDEAFRREREHGGETILRARLEQQLRRLNPALSENAVQRASRQLAQPETSNLALAQQQAHARLTDAAVCYVDFEQPANNNFLFIEAFPISNRMPPAVCDFAVFVNGIPLALVAVGNSNTKEGVAHAARRFVQMQDAAPRLFHTAQILVCVQKNFSGVRMAHGDTEDFASWDEPYPMTWEELRLAFRKIPQRESDLPTSQDLTLAGVLAPRVLLDLFKNFLSYQVAPRLAWSHQYHAVRAACERLAQPGAARAGVIWHPGRSGKTHTFAWLAAQLRRSPEFAGHHLLLVTECEQQRACVRDIFAQQKLAPVYAANELAPVLKLLQRTRPETVWLTPVLVRELLSHAANETVPLLFLFDERTDGLALAEVQRTFPRARLLACSAYPLPRAEAACELLHQLSYAHAQRRGYVLPARFETRLARLHHNFSTAPLLMEANARRVTGIAEDLLEHFAQEVRPHQGKAILLARAAEEAAAYFSVIEPHMPGQVAVLLEPHARELLALYRRFGEVETILPRWLDPKSGLCLLILAVPVPEDLRAPQVHAVYVDRELRGYELWRALALTQMPEPHNKPFGLLVDYCGVSQYLAAELAQFDLQQTEPVLAPRYAERDFEELRLWRRELRALVQVYPEEENFETWLLALEPPELRRAFARTWQGYLHALEQVLPRAQSEQKLMQEALWFDRVRQAAAGFYFDPTLTQAHGNAKVRHLLEQASRVYGVPRVREAARVTSENFLAEVEQLATVQARVLRLQYALQEELRQSVERDPVFYQAVQQRVAKITAERQQKKISDEDALQRLREEAMRLRGGALTPGKAPALAPDALAYWRVLVRYLAPPESAHDRYEELAQRLLAALAPDTKIIDWTLKEDWQREMRRKIKYLLRESYCPEDLLDPLTQAVMQLTKARFG